MKKGLIISLFLLCFALFGCSKNKGFTQTIYAFDTTVTVSIYEGTEANLNELVDMFYDLHKLTDSYHAYDGITNVYKINEGIKAGITSFNVSNDLAYLLAFPAGASVTSEEANLVYSDKIMLGIGTLTGLWKDAIKTKKLPDESTIGEIVEEIREGKYNYSIDLKNNILTVPVGSKVCIDLGSIVKGYATFKAKQFLESVNINKYLIDCGSSSILLGEKANGKSFNVGVRGSDYIIKNVKNCYIGTASILERNAEINGKIYHHIIDPQTGYPTSSYDTIVVKSSEADIDLTDLLATYLMINPDAIDELSKINKYKGYHIYFFNNGNLEKEVEIQ